MSLDVDGDEVRLTLGYDYDAEAGDYASDHLESVFDGETEYLVMYDANPDFPNERRLEVLAELGHAVVAVERATLHRNDGTAMSSAKVRLTRALRGRMKMVEADEVSEAAWSERQRRY